jgi:hypothetical protein
MSRRTELASQVERIIKRIEQLPVLAYDDPFQPNGRPFISRHVLQQELSRDRIKKLLDYRLIRNVDVGTIYDHYICVFGILLQIGKYEHIPYFIEHDHFSDDWLPFRDSAGWFDEHRDDFFSAFYKHQWAFCARTFRLGRLDNIQIQEDRILPIIDKSTLKKGSDSLVQKVEIHSDYNELVPKVSSCRVIHKKLHVLTDPIDRVLITNPQPTPSSSSRIRRKTQASSKTRYGPTKC